MSRALARKITPARVATACCAGLIGFGMADAVVPHDSPSSSVLSAPPSGHGRSTRAKAWVSEAQEVAVRFVTACDTSSAAAPSGDSATEAALAPGLSVPHRPSWPAAWTTESRHTTVALDPPGPPVLKARGVVAVEVTGVMTVTSNSAPPQLVPVSETVLLRPAAGATTGVSGWLVDGVEVGS